MKFFGFECSRIVVVVIVIVIVAIVVVVVAVARGSCYVCHKRAPAWAGHEIDLDFVYVVI